MLHFPEAVAHVVDTVSRTCDKDSSLIDFLLQVVHGVSHLVCIVLEVVGLVYNSLNLFLCAVSSLGVLLRLLVHPSCFCFNGRYLSQELILSRGFV